MRRANEIRATLKSGRAEKNPNSWIDAARRLINTFDEFGQGLQEVLNANGARFCRGAVIPFEAWGYGDTGIVLGADLTEESLEHIHTCGRYWCKGVVQNVVVRVRVLFCSTQ